MADPTQGFIKVRGARVHNLRAVDVDFPRDAVVAVTGVSGSGKSSLAFGAVFAEAQRRYLETLAPYARRLISQVPAPQIDRIEGLPPAVALRQDRGPAGGGRSTVGSLSTLSSTLRLLYSRAGTRPARTPQLDSDAFSPSTVAGACPDCEGLGRTYRTTEATLVPDPSLTIREKAIAAWPGAWHGKNLRDILDALGYDIDRPWRELPQDQRDWILFTDEQPVVTVVPVRGAHTVQGPYEGTYTSARRYVLHTIATTRSDALRRRALSFTETVPCATCAGRRLRPQALAVTVAGLAIDELTARPVSELITLLEGWPAPPVAVPMLDEIRARAATMTRLGLGHLGVDRPIGTLSAGELQRLRLATAVTGTLFGVVYVLDEPSAGLHPADITAVIDVLHELRQAGNTVLVVEHDPAVIRHADWLIDVGPGAGAAGGAILHSGPIAGLAAVPDSITAAHLGDPPPQADRTRRTGAGRLDLRGLTRNTVRNLDLTLPTGSLVAVTGVSGAGKSSLLAAIAEADHGKRVVWLDQSPIGRTPRSIIATYTNTLDTIRTLFADTPAAREHGFGPGRFSFNRPEGRCPSCEGEGRTTVELLFLPSLTARCTACDGARYCAQTLEVTWCGHTIADVLALTVDDATALFADVPAVVARLQMMRKVGLGHLHLGRPTTELSGGEVQRLRLASELGRRSGTRGGTLYLLDEPTTGLHPADVLALEPHLHGLVAPDNLVIMATHDLGLVERADQIVDLGPGAGEAGGRIVAIGTADELAADPTGPTGRHLSLRRQVVARRQMHR